MAVPFPPGEVQAQARLTAFTAGSAAPIHRYGALAICPRSRVLRDCRPTCASGCFRRARRQWRPCTAVKIRQPMRHGAPERQHLAERIDLARVLHQHPLPLSLCARAQFSQPVRCHPVAMTPPMQPGQHGATAGPATHCRRRHAPTAGHRLDAQPDAHGHRFISG